MINAKYLAWIYAPLCLLMLLAAEGYNVDITYVQSAVAKGAVCLDGSPPAYHMSPGFGSGVNNWLLLIEGSAKNLPSSCTSKMAPGMCFFPQYVAQQISTPLFILNAAYDSWQIKNILAPGAADPHGTWHDCKLDITKCSSAQLQTIQDYRSEFLSTLAGIGSSSTRGMFINSCYAHCQAGTQETWLRSDSPILGNTTIAKAVGDWYYDRHIFQLNDCPYPCDKTCHNRVFEDN